MAEKITTPENIGGNTPTQTSTPLALPEKSTVTTDEPKDGELKFFVKENIYAGMSVPSSSSHEFRMITYVMRYCMRHGIKYEFDDYGNIYLTKGTVKEGEYYPCMTSHLDTVQSKQYPYAKVAVRLPLVTEKVAQGTKVWVGIEGDKSSRMGIGADDKGGICICLEMFRHQSVLKAVFFLEEEIGMKGSSHMNKEWFNDVGYVIGYDSPDLNRAAWKSSSTKLFDGAFYKTFLKPVCDKWGVTDFRSEPFTDVSIIAKETDIVCMNFGNGGYNAHSQNEYIILEHMDKALGMGSAIIDSLGKVRHTLSHKSINTEDDAYLATLSSLYRPTTYVHTSGGYTPSTQHSTKPSKEEIRKVKYETLEYVSVRYGLHIEELEKQIKDLIKENVKENDALSKTLIEGVTDIFSAEITF